MESGSGMIDRLIDVDEYPTKAGRAQNIYSVF